MIRLVVSGPPMVRREPLHRPGAPGRLHAFTHPRTAIGVDAWRWRWQQAGCPRIDGPIIVLIRIAVRRPAGHYRANGSTLNATGERAPIPTSCDVDNVSKLVLDALKRHAYEDDRKIGTLLVRKLWGEPEATTVVIASFPDDLDLSLAAAALDAAARAPEDPPMPTVCRSCGAPVLFATTKGGRPGIYDAEPEPLSAPNLVRIEGDRVVAAHDREAGAMPGRWYRSHFATCPFADLHRRA